MAVATPTGMMNAAHTPISQIVPQNAAWMPDWSALIDEKLVMKSQVRLPAPSATTSTSRTPSRRIEMPTQTISPTTKPVFFVRVDAGALPIASECALIRTPACTSGRSGSRSCS